MSYAAVSCWGGLWSSGRLVSPQGRLMIARTVVLSHALVVAPCVRWLVASGLTKRLRNRSSMLR